VALMIRMMIVLSLLSSAAARADEDVFVGRDRSECPDRNAMVSWELQGEVTVRQALKTLGQLVCERYLVPKDLSNVKVTLGVPREKVPLSELRYRVESAFRANGIALRSETFHRPVRELARLAEVPPPRLPASPLEEELARSIHCDGNRCEMPRSLFDKILGDMNQLAAGARIVPSIRDGRADGFKLYAIRPNSLFARLGITNGDTIHTINGQDITTPDKALEVYTKLRNADRLSVTLTRRGQPLTMEYVLK
jgi:hypothetical protein